MKNKIDAYRKQKQKNQYHVKQNSFLSFIRKNETKANIKEKKNFILHKLQLVYLNSQKYLPT